MIVRITARPSISDRTGAPVADEAVLRELVGASSEEACSDYLSAELTDLDLRGGKVALAAEAREDGAVELWVVTEYDSPGALTPAQLEELKQDTVAQWSDGVGRAASMRRRRS